MGAVYDRGSFAWVAANAIAAFGDRSGEHSIDTEATAPSGDYSNLLKDLVELTEIGLVTS